MAAVLTLTGIAPSADAAVTLERSTGRTTVLSVPRGRVVASGATAPVDSDGYVALNGHGAPLHVAVDLRSGYGPQVSSRQSRFAAAVAALVLSTGCVVGGSTGSDQVEPGQPPGTAGSAAPARQVERAIFDRVNDERAERGVAPVEWSDPLATVAREWSERMSRAGQLEHQDVRALMQRAELSHLQAVGENIFTATGPVPAGSVHAGWMRSDNHRRNVVNPGWDRLGVGVFCAQDGSVWATQEFGRTSGADRPPVARDTPPQEPLVHPEDDGPRCS